MQLQGVLKFKTIAVEFRNICLFKKIMIFLTKLLKCDLYKKGYTILNQCQKLLITIIIVNYWYLLITVFVYCSENFKISNFFIFLCWCHSSFSKQFIFNIFNYCLEKTGYIHCFCNSYYFLLLYYNYKL